MILLHQQRFRVAAYHRKVDPEHADQSFAQGLVVPVEVTFEDWLDGRVLRAEAFLDTGADETVISLRWLSEQSEAAGSSRGTLPLTSPTGTVEESIKLAVGGHRLDLGDPDRPVWIGAQGDEVAGIAEMAGCEDILLGRDFITQHGLLLLIDGADRSLSLLLPSDMANRDRRESIRRAFDPRHPAPPASE